MAKTIFILGAGSSRQAGGPLMADFFDKGETLWRLGEIGSSGGDFKRVFEAISHLQAVHSKSELDLNNLETVFTAFEIGKTIQKLPGCEPDKIDELISSLKRVIGVTLERSIPIPVRASKMTVPPPYGAFASLIEELGQKAKPQTSVAIVTFNYDLAADWSLMNARIPYHYGFSESHSSDALPLLKLHGSLNWARVKGTDRVIPWELTNYLNRSHIRISEDTKKINLNIIERLGETPKGTNEELDREPLIVPPTWNKGDYHRILTQVWSRAAKELGEAENIFVSGYSLPETDAFFRLLYALGTVGQTTLKRFWVFDPNPNVKERFERMMGPGAKARFQFFTNNFEESISAVKKELLR